MYMENFNKINQEAIVVFRADHGSVDFGIELTEREKIYLMVKLLMLSMHLKFALKNTNYQKQM